MIAFTTTKNFLAGKTPYVQTSEQMFFYACENLYEATVQATEDAIINALVAAKDMVGKDGTRACKLGKSLECESSDGMTSCGVELGKNKSLTLTAFGNGTDAINLLGCFYEYEK